MSLVTEISGMKGGILESLNKIVDPKGTLEEFFAAVGSVSDLKSEDQRFVFGCVGVSTDFSRRLVSVLEEFGHVLKMADSCSRYLRAVKEIYQGSEQFSGFHVAERTIHGKFVICQPGDEAPWMGRFGAGTVKVLGMRRRDGKVEFGIVQDSFIQKWVNADQFYHELPDC